MRSTLLFLCLALAACGDPAKITNRAAENEADSAAPVVTPGARAVRIGELGPNFRACSAAGTTRNLKAGEALPVRSAPFETASQTGQVASRARFFICTRSLDQKWFGIVYDEAGALAERCGVSEPITGRRDYAGPCRAGWVQSAFVKVIAGEESLPAASPESGPLPEGPGNDAVGA
jgi:hypothetical protein